MSSTGNNPVLVVDADTNIASSLEESFREVHLEVVQAYSATEGLTSACAISPRAILSEVDLPDMSGFTFHRKVSLYKKIAQIPFIYYTERTKEIDMVVGFGIATIREVGYCLRVETNNVFDFHSGPLQSQPHQDEKDLASMMHQTVESRTESGR